MVKKDSNMYHCYQNVLQINVKNEAVLYAIDPNDENFVEQIDYLSHIEDFLHKDNFIPIGFVPTYFEFTSNNDILKKTVLMN